MGKRLIGLTSAAIIGVGAYGVATEGDPLALLKFGEDCVSTQEANIEAARERLAKPNETQQTKRHNMLTYEIAKTAALKHNYTVVDSTAYIKKMQSATSTEQVQSEIRDLTSKYGFSVTFSSNDLRATKYDGTELAKRLYVIPAEVIQSIGVKAIHMGAFLEDVGEEGFASAAKVDVKPGHIGDMSIAPGGGDAVMHELGHAIHQKVCGDGQIRRDEQLGSYNPGGMSFYGVRTQDSTEKSYLYNLSGKHHSLLNSTEDFASAVEVLADPTAIGISPCYIDPNNGTVAEKKTPYVFSRLNDLDGDFGNYMLDLRDAVCRTL